VEKVKTNKIILLLGLFFTAIIISDIVSIVSIYTLDAIHRTLILSAIPTSYWAIKIAEVAVLGVYILGLANGFEGRTLAIVIGFFVVLKILSVLSLSGLETIVTWNQAVQILVVYVSGGTTIYHALGGRSR
jgi:hypothetical protein